MVKTILTGVDSSETAREAVEKAATLAVAFGADLHVLSAFTVNMTKAVQTAHPDTYEEKVVQYAEHAEHTASTVVGALGVKFAALKVTSKSREGEPALALLREAEEIGADLIVVGNKRVQGPARFLGSIARTLASGAKCDLYIVNTHRR